MLPMPLFNATAAALGGSGWNTSVVPKPVTAAICDVAAVQ